MCHAHVRPSLRFVAVHTNWHVRGAIGRHVLGSGMELGNADLALVHRLVAADEGVAAECAFGLGADQVLRLAGAAEAAGQWLQAAQLLLAVSSLGADSCGLHARVEAGALGLQALALLRTRLDDDAGANAIERRAFNNLLMRALVPFSNDVMNRLEVLRQRSGADRVYKDGTDMLKDSLELSFKMHQSE